MLSLRTKLRFGVGSLLLITLALGICSRSAFTGSFRSTAWVPPST